MYKISCSFFKSFALAKSIPILLFAISAPLPKSIKVWVIVTDFTVGSTFVIEALDPSRLVSLSVSSSLWLPLKVTVGRYELLEIFNSCLEIFKLSLSALSSGLLL